MCGQIIGFALVAMQLKFFLLIIAIYVSHLQMIFFTIIYDGVFLTIIEIYVHEKEKRNETKIKKIYR